MAGVKVTDLSPLTTADAADIFYVVDSSANQSKQVDLTTIASALDTLLSYVPLRGTAYTGIGQVTGDIEVDVAAGGQMTLRFPSGDIIGLGVDYGGYSAISFFNGTANETCYLYLRGGDLYIENVDTGQGTGAIIGQINGLNATKQNFSNGINVTGQFAVGDGNCVYYDNSKVYFDNGLEASYRGYSKLPSYYFIDSCSYTQVGTSAPTENSVFETQVGDGIVTKTITYVATGHYHITYNVGLITGYMPTNVNKVKVIATSGHDSQFCLISAQVTSPSASEIQISVFTRSDNGSLTNGILKASNIDVMWYV